MFERSHMVVFHFLGIKTSAFTACVLSNLLRNRTVKELYFLLIQCLFLLLFRCPLRAFRQSMFAAKADTCVRIPTHKALQTHQFRQCRARADKAAIAFPYGKDFFICLLCQTYCETVPWKKYTFCHADTCASLSLNGGIFPQSDVVAVPILAPAYPLPSQKCNLPFAFASAFRLDLKDGFSLAVLPCQLSEFRFA